MTNSRAKGARFERLLASRLRDAGYHGAMRTAQAMGKNSGVADVIGVPGIHVEAKHYKTGLSLVYDWMEQAVRDHRKGNLPTVFCKNDNSEILVVMRFDDWVEATREYIAQIQSEDTRKG